MGNSRGGKVCIGWHGPRRNEFGWLWEKLKALGHPLEPVDCMGQSPSQIERIIATCEGRLESNKLLHEVGTSPLPIAIATDGWWEGAGRTGLASSPVPLIPWFRFWDSWCHWLEIENASLYPAPPRHLHSLPGDPWPVSRPTRGLILSNCSTTASAIAQIAALAGSETEQAFFSSLQSEERLPLASVDWIAWDHSTVDTIPFPDRPAAGQQPFCEYQCGVQAEMIRARFPAVLLIAYTTFARYDLWETLHRSGVNEFITKPESGISLPRILKWYFPGESAPADSQKQSFD